MNLFQCLSSNVPPRIFRDKIKYFVPINEWNCGRHWGAHTDEIIAGGDKLNNLTHVRIYNVHNVIDTTEIAHGLVCNLSFVVRHLNFASVWSGGSCELCEFFRKRVVQFIKLWWMACSCWPCYRLDAHVILKRRKGLKLSWKSLQYLWTTRGRRDSFDLYFSCLA